MLEIQSDSVHKLFFFSLQRCSRHWWQKMHERNSELISGRNLDVGRFFTIFHLFLADILLELHFSHSDTLVL